MRSTLRSLALTQKASQWYVGVLLDCVATLAGTLGKQMLRYASITRRKRYAVLGILFTGVIDPVFDVCAYSFAAQSIISPMAGMVVVWNVILAPCTLGEKLTLSRKHGAALILAGTVCVGLFGNHNEVQRSVDEYLVLFSSPTACAYYAAFCVWSAICFYYHRYSSEFVSRSIVGAYGGSLAGNMFTTKAAVGMLKCFSEVSDACSPNPFLTIYPYLFIVASLALACTSLYMLAVGLTKSEALYMITVFEGFMIISGSLSGNLVMDERDGQPARVLALYFVSIGVTLAGLIVLCRGERILSNGLGTRILNRTEVLALELDEMYSSDYPFQTSETPFEITSPAPTPAVLKESPLVT